MERTVERTNLRLQLPWPSPRGRAAIVVAILLAGVIAADVRGEAASPPPYYAIQNVRVVSGTEAGNVALTGLDPLTTYAVSLAALDGNGRIGAFSPEIIVEPSPG